MTPETVVALAQGAGGAIAVLVIGFYFFARAIVNGTLVPGRYYDEALRDNESLRRQLNRALDNTDRSIETIEKSASASARASRTRGGPG